jgi:hypothetical protein
VGLTPPARSVRAYAQSWTPEQFAETMRTGVDPAGHAIRPSMLWQMIGQMDDVEVNALYLYIRSLE